MKSKSKRRRSVALDTARAQAKAHFGPIAKSHVLELTSAADASTRLYALCLMRQHIYSGGSPLQYADTAEALIADPDNNCRWQAAIVVSECITHDAAIAWRAIQKYGDSSDDDMRTAIATTLLEELLEFDFDTYFPKVQEEVRAGRTRFLDTLEMCWFDENSGPKYQKAQRYVKNGNRGRST